MQSIPLVEPNKVLLPSLHIKLGVLKNFLKAIDREGGGFTFFQVKFPRISRKKLKDGILDGPQIREFMKDPKLDEALSGVKLFTWQSLKSVVTDFLTNSLSAEYEKEIEELVKSFCQLWGRMSVKLHFLLSYFDYFLKNCGDLSEELGEHFHQDIPIMQERYQGRWDVNSLADNCWCLKRNSVAAEHRKKSLKIPFIHVLRLITDYGRGDSSTSHTNV